MRSKRSRIRFPVHIFTAKSIHEKDKMATGLSALINIHDICLR